MERKIGDAEMQAKCHVVTGGNWSDAAASLVMSRIVWEPPEVRKEAGDGFSLRASRRTRLDFRVPAFRAVRE